MVEKLLSDEIIKISSRNLSILDKNWDEYRKNDYFNTAYLNGQNIPLEFLGYHVAIGNQKVLTASRFREDEIDLSLNHIFFCSDKPSLEFYLGKSIGEFLKSDSEEMVYFVDFRKIKQARIQISYKSPVIFQDEISKKESEYVQGRCSYENLKDAYANWLLKYTKTFNPNQLARLLNKEKGDYVLVRSPIKIIKD